MLRHHNNAFQSCQRITSTNRTFGLHRLPDAQAPSGRALRRGRLTVVQHAGHDAFRGPLPREAGDQLVLAIAVEVGEARGVAAAAGGPLGRPLFAREPALAVAEEGPDLPFGRQADEVAGAVAVEVAEGEGKEPLRAVLVAQGAALPGAVGPRVEDVD